MGNKEKINNNLKNKRMKKNYTHIVLLVDRSGSMQSIKNDMEGGIQVFLEEQKKLEGDCTITVAQFDDVYEVLYDRTPLNEVKEVKIQPRNMTALIDSMVRLINEVGVDLAEMAEDERPDRVLFVTITDGQENASIEFKSEDLKALIEQQENDFSWNFTYIGANQDAFTESSKFGGKFGNSLNYTASADGVKSMFTKLSDATVRYRNLDTDIISASAGNSFMYTEEEQKDEE